MRFAPLVLATLCVAVLFVGLDHVGFLDWREARDAEGGREARLIVTYGALGAALASAGPLAALWPLGGLALYLALTGSHEAWRRARPRAGLVIMAGIALPWYGAMVERHGLPFLGRALFF